MTQQHVQYVCILIVNEKNWYNPVDYRYIWCYVPTSRIQPPPSVFVWSPRPLDYVHVWVLPPGIPSQSRFLWDSLYKTPVRAPPSATYDGSFQNSGPSGWSLGSQTHTWVVFFFGTDIHIVWIYSMYRCWLTYKSIYFHKQQQKKHSLGSMFSLRTSTCILILSYKPWRLSAADSMLINEFKSWKKQEVLQD